jgi:hypothetical protein
MLEDTLLYADPYPGHGTFLTPESGIRDKPEHPGCYFCLLRNYQFFGLKILNFFDADTVRDLVNPKSGIRDEKSRIRDKNPRSATLVLCEKEIGRDTKLFMYYMFFFFFFNRNKDEVC